MRKWLNAGTILGGFGGAIAAAVAVYELARPGPIATTDDVVAALHEIRAALNGGTVDLADRQAREDIAEAARPVADLLSRNLNALDSAAAAQLGGVRDAAPGETVEFDLPGGGRVAATLMQWNQVPPNAVLRVDGERIVTAAGWQGPAGATGCTITYAGPTRDPDPLARFRLNCP